MLHLYRNMAAGATHAQVLLQAGRCTKFSINFYTAIPRGVQLYELIRRTYMGGGGGHKVGLFSS
jgi:hypothetical protein